MPVAVIINYNAKPGMADAAAEQLSELIATVVAEESDCLSIDLHRDPKVPERMLLYERWTSEAAYFGDHMNTPHILEFRRTAGEFFAGAAEIRVWQTLVELG